MRIIMLGAPGAGKGTQAAKVAEKKNIPHISTGEIFRYNIRDKTELGIEAKNYIDKGLLVPDNVTLRIVKERIMNKDCKNGFVLDGFPRTINQAKFLEKDLEEINTKLDIVLDIHVDDDVIIKRLSGRRMCPKCQKGYHLLYNKPKNNELCDKCNVKLSQRDDDKEETVLKRLKTYHAQTEPLIAFYEKRNLLTTVNGRNSIEDTKREVFKVLGVDLCI